MKSFFPLTFFILVLFSACISNKPNHFSDSGYYIEKDGIYYHKGFPDKPYRLEAADKKTFEIISDSVSGTRFAKDKAHVFISGTILKNADPKSFTIIDRVFTKDNDHVFLNDDIFSDDPSHFEVISINMAKDAQYVYAFAPGKTIVSDDPVNFKNIAGDYYRASNNLYFMFKPVEGVDLNSFEYIDEGYALDKNTIIYREKIIVHSDIKTFEILPGPYSRDKNRVYFLGKELEGADPNTFIILNEKFQCAHDATKAFYHDKLIPDLNPSSFPKNKICTNCDEKGFYFSE